MTLRWNSIAASHDPSNDEWFCSQWWMISPATANLPELFNLEQW